MKSSQALCLAAIFQFWTMHCNSADSRELARSTVVLQGGGPNGAFSGYGAPGADISTMPIYYYMAVEPGASAALEDEKGEWCVGPLTVADVGNSFTLDLASATEYDLNRTSGYLVGEFETISTRLTDGTAGVSGIGDYFTVGMGFMPVLGAGSDYGEHLFFHDNSPINALVGDITVVTDIFFNGTNDIDLAGSLISSISMRVDDLTLFAIGDAVYFKGGMTLTFSGNVLPEPSAVLLAFTGIATVLFRRPVRRCVVGD